jgi:hypothetical protein
MAKNSLGQQSTDSNSSSGKMTETQKVNTVIRNMESNVAKEKAMLADPNTSPEDKQRLQEMLKRDQNLLDKSRSDLPGAQRFDQLQAEKQASASNTVGNTTDGILSGVGPGGFASVSDIPSLDTGLSSATGEIPGLGAAEKASSAVSSLLGGVGSAISGVTSAVGNVVGGVTNAIGSAVGGITSAVSGAISGATGLLNNISGGVISSLGGALSKVKDMTSGPISFLTSGINSAGNVLSGIKGFMNEVSSTLANGMNIVKSLKSGVLGAVGGLVSSVASGISGVIQTASQIYNTVQDVKGAISSVKGLVSDVKDQVKSITNSIKDALPSSITKYFNNNNTTAVTTSNLINSVTRTVAGTSLSTQYLNTLIDKYEQEYPLITTNDGTAFTTEYSTTTTKHLSNLFNLIKTTCPQLKNDLPIITDTAIKKNIYDLLIIDLALNGLSDLLKILTACNLCFDDRTKLILKDLLYDVADKGDVYTTSVIMDYINPSLVQCPNDLIKTLLYNSDLSKDTAKAAFSKICNKLNKSMNDVILISQEYSSANNINLNENIYDLNQVAGIKIKNPNVINETIGKDTADMFMEIYALYAA